LVDPDNRRPVAFDHLRGLLAEVRALQGDRIALCRDLRRTFTSGAIKLYVTHTILQLRRSRPDLFRRGDYEPAASTTERAFAFTRSWGDECVVVAIARLTWPLSQGGTQWPVGAAWSGESLELPRPGAYCDIFTDRRIGAERRVGLAEVFAELPVAVLLLEGGSRR
jgi:(1->4)-alpha-D-glucan 1-alpha-D-glucosylmutase